MASSMTKYAMVNWMVCRRARVICCKAVGRKCISVTFFGQLSFSEPLAVTKGVRVACSRLYPCERKRSYSFAKRRKNSRSITSRMTPMQEPANIPRDVICHDLARKPFPMTLTASSYVTRRFLRNTDMHQWYTSSTTSRNL